MGYFRYPVAVRIEVGAVGHGWSVFAKRMESGSN